MGLVKPIPVRGLLRLHSAVPAEPPVGPGRPTGVKAPEIITVLVPQRLVLPVPPTKAAVRVTSGLPITTIPEITGVAIANMSVPADVIWRHYTHAAAEYIRVRKDVCRIPTMVLPVCAKCTPIVFPLRHTVENAADIARAVCKSYQNPAL